MPQLVNAEFRHIVGLGSELVTVSHAKYH